MDMECVTTGNSESKQTNENPGSVETPAIEPKIEEPVIMMEVEKKEEETGENNMEQSDNEPLGGHKDVENILGVIGKFLYRQRKKPIKMKKMPHARRTKKLNIRKRGPTKRRGRVVRDEICHPKKRNWKRRSIYPFINFMRIFRKTVPKECPADKMAMTANEIWLRMCSEEKLPFIKRAERAIHNGYTD